MIKTKKLLTVLLTGVLALLMLFAGGFIPATVKAEEVNSGAGIEKISILDTGAVSFRFYYDGDSSRVNSLEAKDFIPEEGITGHNQTVKIDSLWEGTEGLSTIQFYAIIDFTGTEYENFNNVTIEVSNLSLSFTYMTPDGEGDGEGNVTEGNGETWTGEEDSTGYVFLNNKTGRSTELTDGFSMNVTQEEGPRIVLTTDSLFKHVNSYSFDNYKIPECTAVASITFDVACWVEIVEDKIGTTEEGEPEDALGNKAENWLNETGDKISSFIQDKTGIVIGGTSSIVVLVIVAIIVIKRLKRR